MKNEGFRQNRDEIPGLAFGGICVDLQALGEWLQRFPKALSAHSVSVW
jgi:hypothetical protein